MEGMVFFIGLIVVVVLIVLFFAFLAPDLGDAIIEMDSHRSFSRRGGLLAILAHLGRFVRGASGQFEEDPTIDIISSSPLFKDEIQEKKKNHADWKCPNCGRMNHGFQELCACGQDRDDIEQNK
ncbi:MAG: hypothetical protein J5546_02465 [Lachnospiraceae bacterium]|nr:hypothetical protein [Lachnospiraceae bacterium]